jgi:hypothetical protein
MTETSVNLKYSLVLTRMFRFKPASQFAERCYSVVSRALNMENIISKKNGKLKGKTGKFVPVLN